MIYIGICSITLEKNVYSTLEWSVLQNVDQILLVTIVTQFFYISLLIFCLVILSISERTVEVCNLIISLCISSFISISFFCLFVFCFSYFVALLFGAYAFKIAMSSWQIHPLSLYNVLFLWSFYLLWSLLYQILIYLVLLSFDQYLHVIFFLHFAFNLPILLYVR